MVARLEVELAGRADVLDDGVVVLATGGRRVVGDVGDGLDRLVPRGLGVVAGGLGGLHAGGELLDLREQGLLLLALRLGDEGAAGLLLGAPGLEVGDRLAPRGVGGQRPVHHVGGQPALGLGGTYAVGVVTEQARVDHRGKAIRRDSMIPNRFGHTSQVTPASRNRSLAWALLTGGLFAVLAYLVTQDRAPLDAFDVEGRRLEDWADDHALLIDTLRVVETAFGTIGMTILTVAAGARGSSYAASAGQRSWPSS